MTPFLFGFATSIGLIAAIGAQNAFVLRQGIRNEHVLPVVTLCAASDLVLILAGIAGMGALITAHPALTTAARYAGAAFLLGYGLLAARRALRPAALTPADAAPGRLGAVLLTCLALTFLNPHVYLDTVVLLGTLANQQSDGRWHFGAGAATASAVWFFGLGFGARRLAGLFAAPVTWRILDVLIAVTMLALGMSLALTLNNPTVATLRSTQLGRNVFTTPDLAGAIAYASPPSHPEVAEQLPPVPAKALG